MPWFHIYNLFKCHFKPNQKCQQDMNDPVSSNFGTLMKYRVAAPRWVKVQNLLLIKIHNFSTKIMKLDQYSYLLIRAVMS